MARPTVMTQEVIDKLEYAFALGCSDNEACLHADISPATLYNHQEKHPEFLERKTLLKDRPLFLAREAVLKGFRHDPNLGLKYLERKLRNEFSLKVEQDLNHSGEVSFINDVPRPNKEG